MALPAFLKRDLVAGFWRWFAKNAPQISADLKALRDDALPSKLATDDVSRRLQRIHPSLVHEIGGEADGPIELIISADGDLDGFAAVARTVSAAPPIEGFNISAFRKRGHPDERLGMFGHEVSLRQIRYETWPDDDGLLAVRLYIPFDGLDEDELDAMAFILLDMALGEYDVATGLGTIETAVGRPSNARPLSDLAEEFDARKRVVLH